MTHSINYELIGDVCRFIRQETEYRYVEAPWIVSGEVFDVTFPFPRYEFQDKTCPVGSAEQGLIALALKKKIFPGEKVFAAGPCFRDDDLDQYHQKTFFKVELFHLLDENIENEDEACDALILTSRRIMQHAAAWYKFGVKIDVVKKEREIDLEINGVEVGSYGLRRTSFNGKNIVWIYGTALALPRFTQALLRV